MYTAIFTPYVAAFLLNEPDQNRKSSKKYGDDPIVVIDLIGQYDFNAFQLKWNRTLFLFEMNYMTIKSSHSNVIDRNFKWGHRVILVEIASES
jgi:hypothetical protein